MRLDLVVAFDSLLVRRRHSRRAAGALSRTRPGAMVIFLRVRRHRARGAVVRRLPASTRSLVVGLLQVLMRLLMGAMVASSHGRRRRRRLGADKVPRHNAGATPLGIGAMRRHARILVKRVGILEDDVPRVQHARHDAEHAQCQVDDRVGAAQAALDPH